MRGEWAFGTESSRELVLGPGSSRRLIGACPLTPPFFVDGSPPLPIGSPGLRRLTPKVSEGRLLTPIARPDRSIPSGKTTKPKQDMGRQDDGRLEGQGLQLHYRCLVQEALAR